MICNVCVLNWAKLDSIRFNPNLAIQVDLITLLIPIFKKYYYLQQLYGKTTSLDHIQLALFLL